MTRLIVPLMLIGLASILASCGGSTVSVRPEGPTIAPIPSDLTTRCKDPARVTSGRSADIAKAWGADRVALVECRDRHDALVDFVEDRDARLRGDAP